MCLVENSRLFCPTESVHEYQQGPRFRSCICAPVSQIPDDHTGHSVQFYVDDAFLLDGLSRFIGTALGAGDAAIVLATQAHREALE